MMRPALPQGELCHTWCASSSLWSRRVGDLRLNSAWMHRVSFGLVQWQSYLAVQEPALSFFSITQCILKHHELTVWGFWFPFLFLGTTWRKLLSPISSEGQETSVISGLMLELVPDVDTSLPNSLGLSAWSVCSFWHGFLWCIVSICGNAATFWNLKRITDTTIKGLLGMHMWEVLNMLLLSSKKKTKNNTTHHKWKFMVEINEAQVFDKLTCDWKTQLLRNRPLWRFQIETWSTFQIRWWQPVMDWVEIWWESFLQGNAQHAFVYMIHSSNHALTAINITWDEIKR